MESSNILQLYRVIIRHVDGNIRNTFCFKDENDAMFIAGILGNHYCYIYGYRPFVKVESTSCITYHANDLIFIKGKEFKLSKVNEKMSELKTKINNNKEDTNIILQLLGEKPLIPKPKNNACECFICLSVCFCFLCPWLTTRNIDTNPSHYKYSVY